MDIDNFKKADWAVEKIAEHLKEIKKFEVQRDMFIDEYQKRIDAAVDICEENCAEHLRLIDNLKMDLKKFAVDNLPKGKKSIKLPQGTLKFTTAPVCYHFQNGEKPASNSLQLINYLKANDSDYIKVTESADWAKFKKLLKFDSDGTVFNSTTGEVITELWAEKLDDNFDVIFKE